MNKALAVLVVAALVLLFPSDAHAAINDVDGILAKFQRLSVTVGAALYTLALGTFGLLSIISLVLAGIRVRMSSGDISDLMHAIVHEVIYISFFFFLLASYSTWGPLIIESFNFAATQAGGVKAKPQDIISAAVTIATAITDKSSILHPGDTIAMAFCGVVVLFCILAIAIMMIVALAEAWLLIGAGQLLMCFGALRFTSDIPITLLRTLAGIGAKLFILQILAGVGVTYVMQMVTEIKTVDFATIYIVMAISFVLAAVIHGVPGRFERLFHGVGSGGLGEFIGAAGAVGVASALIARRVSGAMSKVTGGAMGAAGGIAAVSSAANLAGAQMAANGGPASTAGRVAAMIGSTASNMASAKVADIGRGLRGDRSSYGQSGFRQAAINNQRRESL